MGRVLQDRPDHLRPEPPRVVARERLDDHPADAVADQDHLPAAGEIDHRGERVREPVEAVSAVLRPVRTPKARQVPDDEPEALAETATGVDPGGRVHSPTVREDEGRRIVGSVRLDIDAGAVRGVHMRSFTPLQPTAFAAAAAEQQAHRRSAKEGPGQQSRAEIEAPILAGARICQAVPGEILDVPPRPQEISGCDQDDEGQQS
jgi:hypothetical protein